MPKCKNDPSKSYKGTEPSPKGLGWCAHSESVGKTINGNRICVIAITVPCALNISWILCFSSIRPIHTMTSLRTPCVWSKTIQEVVLTSRDVQNGSNTSIINKFEYRTGKLASRYAIG